MVTREEAAAELLKRKRAEDSLYEFIKQAWYYIEGTDNFVDNWHLKAIAEHLECLFRGDIMRLLINQPPRTGKTNLASVAFPAWVWIHAPETRFLYASYGEGISMDSSVKCRDLIESDWYQSRWSHKFTLNPSQNTKMRFDNDKKGYRIATSVGGATTGFGGDIIFGDDLNATNDISETVLETTGNWFTRALSTRLNSLKKGKMGVVQQRVHEDDISGRILANDNGEWTKLILPMEFEPDRKCTTIPLPSTNGKPWEDPRKKQGELLWPTHIGTKELNLLKASFHHNMYVIAGQLQQRPAPTEGGIIKRAWFKLWPADKPLPEFQYIIQSYDTSFTEDSKNDPNAGQTWGVFPEDGRWCGILLDCWQKHMEYHKLKKKVIDDFNKQYGDPAHGIDLIIIEDKASGILLRRDLQQAGLPVRPFNPGRHDKEQRMHTISYLVQNGLIYIPESTNSDRRGLPVNWAMGFLDEVTMFPHSKFKDQSDAFSQAMTVLKDMKFVANAPEYTEDDEDDYKEPYERTGGHNPYAV